MCRLEMHELPLDLGAVFLSWLHRPAIEITLTLEPRYRCRIDARQDLVDSLNSVYPF